MKIALLLVGLIGAWFGFQGFLASSGSGGDVRVTYWSSGEKKSAATWIDGRLDGTNERWHADGSRAWTGTYEEGRREGEWLFWNEDGSVDEERSGLYAAGKRVEGLPRASSH